MNAFDIMAEAKIRQWEEDRRNGRDKPSSNHSPMMADSSESLERRLYHDIRKLVIQSRMEQGQESTRLQERAQKLQVQLSARLEKCGYNRLSRLFADEIRKLEQEARAARNNRTKLEELMLRLEE